MKSLYPSVAPWGNRDRAAKARNAVKNYAGKGEPLSCHIADALCDIMHLCDQSGDELDWQDFDDLLSRARDNYDAEKSEESES